MNRISIVIAVLLAAAVIAALVFVRKHKSGCGGCSGCEGCSKSCDRRQR